MKKIVCEMCGSNDFQKEDGMFVCQNCGCKYSVEEARKLMIEGSVDVTGSTVKVDASEKLNNLYQLARRARDAENSEMAAKYYNNILMEAPNDWEAAFYSAYYSAMNCKIAGIRNAAITFGMDVKEILKIIKEDDRLDKKACYVEVEMRTEALYCIYLENIIQGTKGYSNPTNAIEFHKRQSEGVGCMLDSVADAILALFDDKEYSLKLYEMAYDTLKAHSLGSNVETKIRKLDPNFVIPTEGKKEGCYVATAVYGSYDCPEVWTLRRYRDYELSETWYGRMFIHVYYMISPTVVKWFGDSTWFKKMWRGKLDQMVKNLQDRGYECTPYKDRNWYNE